MTIYTVQPKDSIYTIAQKYGVSMQQLIDDNGLKDMRYLIVGQSLVIRADDVRHVVHSGESLHSIANQYDVTQQNILAANPAITAPNSIRVGQVITIPLSLPKQRTISVNGYVFPNIGDETLAKTLPHLTFISIFSYEVHPDGSLEPIADENVIAAASAKQTAPLMVITNIKQGGSFDSELAHTILNDDALQNNILENVMKTLPKGYFGLDIDFEYIYPQDREKYNRFVKKAVDTLHPQGYSVSVALAPKASADQPGLLYESHDYPFHGAAVDHVILMTYEWGYTRGPAQAVAPLDKVKQVLDYAVSAMPSQKILMGMPNYGYDWTLPFVQGSAARSMSNTEALSLAQRVGAVIKFDEQAQAPYFNYYDKQGRKHVAWFEDARSIAAKLALVEAYNLGGVSYWTVNKFFPQNWLVLESMYNVKKIL
ncbi:MAG: LysM peptidoglycan-binding domain-containing protein [Candidatus Fimivivens sp.]